MWFTDADATSTSPVVIVSDSVVRRFWPGQNAIGKRITIGGLDSTNPWLEIVGTVAETKYRTLPRNPTADPDLYFPALDCYGAAHQRETRQQEREGSRVLRADATGQARVRPGGRHKPDLDLIR
jgi:hypothetical protein